MIVGGHMLFYPNKINFQYLFCYFKQFIMFRTTYYNIYSATNFLHFPKQSCNLKIFENKSWINKNFCLTLDLTLHEINELFPHPTVPTTATIFPGSTFKLIFCNVGFCTLVSSSQEKVPFSTTIADAEK